MSKTNLTLPIHKDYSLKKLHTFGVEAHADYVVEISHIHELTELIKSDFYKKVPNRLIIGGGSNVLFTQNWNGLVIQNKLQGIELMDHADYVELRVMGGTNWHELVCYCVDRNIGGLENLSFIPGTVGAAPIQNIGAYGVELEQVFHCLQAMHLQTAEVKTFNHKDCEFGYRDSVFKREEKGKWFITEVVLRLPKPWKANVSYKGITHYLEEKGWPIDIKHISKAVIEIRQSKLPDPSHVGNAGSFFKNPELPRAQFESLKQCYPDIPGFMVSESTVKVPAAWLIEQCGWKGKSLGSAATWKHQPLVLVNAGNANGKEILTLAMNIQKSVFDTFSVEIIPEVNII